MPSVTEMQEFGCHRLYRWQIEQGLFPKKPIPALEGGQAFHKAMDAWYTTHDIEATLFAFREYATKTLDGADGNVFADMSALLDRFDLTEQMIHEYFDHCSREQSDVYWEVVATEFAFKLPIENSTETMFGRIDMIVRDLRNNQFWIVDHKTASELYTSEQVMRDFQFGAYMWACKELWPDMDFGGLIVNVVRMKRPTEPKMLKDGAGLSQDSSILTTRMTYEASLRRLGITDFSPYEPHLARLASNQKFFQRLFRIWTPVVHERFTSQLIQLAQDITFTRSNETGYGVPHANWMCDYMCDFANPCMVVEQGGDPTIILDLMFEKRERYGEGTFFVTKENAAQWLQEQLNPTEEEA